MKITVCVGGKWTAFESAEHLEKRGLLHRLLTTYYGGKRGLLPLLRRDLEAIPPGKVHTFLLPELLKRLRLSTPYRWRGPLLYAAYERFDRWASSRLGECDLLLVWSSFGRYTMRAAKHRGATTVLVRSAAHTLAQKHIVEEELARVNLRREHELLYEPLVCKQLEEYEAADYILVNSRYVVDTFIQAGIAPDKLVCVPHGILTSHFSRAPKEDGQFRILYVGMLSLEKGVHHLLEAVSRLKAEDHADVDLWLVGKILPEVQTFLRRYRGLFKAVGPVPRVKLPWYYSQASVLVLPSLQEGFGLVVPEAMACGVPVICTPTGAAEVVREGVDGFIVPFADPEALRQRLLNLYRRPEEVARLGHNAYQRAQEFSVDAYGERLSKALQGLTRRPTRIERR
ncbi:MAG: glycosyltransferase family 4 protein [Chloroflexi bacterium]|nr:glycosyltransferase family 4 protein [Chloroflexota bacterium]